MRILLDSQTILWLAEWSQHRLSKQSQAILQDASNELYVSYLSFLELSIKAATGKLHFDISVIDDLRASGVQILYPDMDLLSRFTVYDQNNKDPFDNLLITVALQHDLYFMTSDTKITRSLIADLKTIKN